jgi:hypothetical protein
MAIASHLQQAGEGRIISPEPSYVGALSGKPALTADHEVVEREVLEFRLVRLGVVGGILGFLFLFFTPLIHYSIPYQCNSVGYGCGAAAPVSGFYTGFNSLGLKYLHWGASSGGVLGSGSYTPPSLTFAVGGEPSQMTAFGAFFSVILPLIVTAIALLGPEIVGLSGLARAGFVSLGVAVFGFSVLMLGATLVPQVSEIALAGLVLLAEGVVIIWAGLHPEALGLSTSQIKQPGLPSSQ